MGHGLGGYLPNLGRGCSSAKKSKHLLGWYCEIPILTTTINRSTPLWAAHKILDIELSISGNH